MKRSSFLIVTAATAATAGARTPVRAALRREGIVSSVRVRRDRSFLRGTAGGCASHRRGPRDPAMAGYTLADVL